jgi:hypothetical protein
MGAVVLPELTARERAQLEHWLKIQAAELAHSGKPRYVPKVEQVVVSSARVLRAREAKAEPAMVSCAWCGVGFWPTRAGHVYCSVKCRNRKAEPRRMRLARTGVMYG